MSQSPPAPHDPKSTHSDILSGNRVQVVGATNRFRGVAVTDEQAGYVFVVMDYDALRTMWRTQDLERIGSFVENWSELLEYTPGLPRHAAAALVEGGATREAIPTSDQLTLISSGLQSSFKASRRVGATTRRYFDKPTIANAKAALLAAQQFQTAGASLERYFEQLIKEEEL